MTTKKEISHVTSRSYRTGVSSLPIINGIVSSKTKLVRLASPEEQGRYLKTSLPFIRRALRDALDTGLVSGVTEAELDNQVAPLITLFAYNVAGYDIGASGEQPVISMGVTAAKTDSLPVGSPRLTPQLSPRYNGRRLIGWKRSSTFFGLPRSASNFPMSHALLLITYFMLNETIHALSSVKEEIFSKYDRIDVIIACCMKAMYKYQTSNWWLDACNIDLVKRGWGNVDPAKAIKSCAQSLKSAGRFPDSVAIPGHGMHRMTLPLTALNDRLQKFSGLGYYTTSNRGQSSINDFIPDYKFMFTIRHFAITNEIYYD